MNKYAVIFDMDGVIAHTNPYHTIAFKQFFDKYNVPYTEQEFEDHMYGKHNDYIMRYFFKQELSDGKVQRLAEEKEALFREIYRGHLKPIDGLPEFLAALKDGGFGIGVATSAPRANLDFILDGLGLRPLMGSILASEDVSAHKPNPEIYLKSIQNLGVKSAHSVIFEDSSSGVTAATRAGARVVGVLTTHSKAQLPPCQYYIDNYHDIDVARIKQILA